MNTNINSPEFWEQVKKDFENSNAEYICHASELFEQEWNTHESRGLIKWDAEDFLSKRIKWKIFEIGFRSLFCHKENSDHNYYRPLRLEFLNYMINRTRNEQPTL